MIVARMAIANVLVRDNHPTEAITLMSSIEEATGSTDEKHIAWQFLCDLHRRQRDFDTASDCLGKLSASPDLSAAQQQAVTTLLALIAEERKAAVAPPAPTPPPAVKPQ